ncbi:tripartite tricarboxylate transporter substrate binding protein [Achromobacter sp. NFACC18-2]|uniref:tripartite tricarboxylate transporter substrate binding protein n=1 Tax=Achromobacter sp. NFACC18-2 TaxID=1564112 RepID=UPI0008C8AF09|nr:tripartite tricarboxylate transporter substrate binding protein [Achromobacter sp. NFACC18-2]SEK11288.1 Tripartite-type tricarboxylate transporter, receptor component TctC [Achromobacter sp. NFACC18-2]
MKQKNLFTRGGMALAAAVLTLGAAAAPQARAAFPDRPLRIVVPFTPGGGTDLIARQLAKGLTQELGQTVVVENRPGGSTIIGTENVAKSPPDGYTLLMSTFAHAVNPAIHKKLPYDTDRAFAPVAMIGKSPNVLVVSPKSPFKSVQDILAYARAHPGKLTFGSYGNGTSAHLAGELFKSLGKVDILHVPYKGAGPGINDLIGGQIDMIFSTSASVSSHIKSGQLRALAVTTQQRSPAYPGVPTVAESGEAGYFVDSWYGVFVPKGTPAAVIDRLNAAIRKASQDPEFRAALELEGLAPDVGTPAALGQYVKEEEARWSRIVRDAGITDKP